MLALMHAFVRLLSWKCRQSLAQTCVKITCAASEICHCIEHESSALQVRRPYARKLYCVAVICTTTVGTEQIWACV